MTGDLDLVGALVTRIVDELERRGLAVSAGGVSRIDTPWLTTNEAADYLRASKQRIFDLTSQGRLRVHKDGARNLYRREDLDECVRAERAA